MLGINFSTNSKTFISQAKVIVCPSQITVLLLGTNTWAILSPHILPNKSLNTHVYKLFSFQYIPVHVTYFCVLCDVKIKMFHLRLIINDCQLASQFFIVREAAGSFEHRQVI